MSRNILGIIFFSSFVLLGCKGKKGEEHQIFRYNQIAGITSLDPAFSRDQANQWVVNQMFNGLVQLNAKLEVVPCIAKKWKISEDGLTYTFMLKKNVFFHDHSLFKDGIGRKVVAEDFVYSFQRLMDKNVASPGSWIFNGRVDTITPFKAINDSVLQIKLLSPFRPFLGILTMQYCSVVPKEAAEHFGKDFGRNPVGTGPFKFKLWQSAVALLMVKNENYFEKDKQGNPLPYLDGVKVSFMDNKQTEFLKLITGELDFVSDVDASFRNEVLTTEGELQSKYSDKIVLRKSVYLNTEYLGILVDTTNPILKKNPLKRKLVRQAINYAIDKQKMLIYLRGNIGKPANAGFVAHGLPSFDSIKVKGYEYNPKKSAELLAKAGFPNGKSLPTIKLFGTPVSNDICAFIQKELDGIGIKVNIEIIAPSFLREMISKSQAAFFKASWVADYSDAESFLTVFYGNNPAPPNYTRFNNPVFNHLYEMAVKENNNTVRYKYYQEMDKIIIEEAPIVPLFYDEVLQFTQPNITGLEVNAMNMLTLKKVKLEKEEQ